MIKKSITLMFLLACFNVFSQEVKDYQWEEKPIFEKIPEEFKNEQAVVLLDRRWVHTRVGGYAFASFVMNHMVVKINTQDAVNKYNKVSAEDGSYIRTVKDFHARIIKPNGEIKVLPKEKIIETEVDKVKSIVFEGVEVGDILEYYFILKENPSSYGVEIYQKDIPVLSAEFITTNSGVSFYCYPHEKFESKSDSSKKIFQAKNIPAYKEEKDSKNIKNLIKIIFNVSVIGQPMQFWGEFFNTYFKKPTFTYFKKNQAKEFVENLKLDGLNTEEKLIRIDNYIKDNFDFVWKGETARKIKNLNNGKQKLTAGDIFDLYGFTLRSANIEYEIVAAVDRFVADINTYRYVKPIPHEFMYYIPATKKFFSPYEKYLSYGYPVYEAQGSKGLLYNPATKTAQLNFLTLPIAPAEYNLTETKSTVSLSEDLAQASLEREISTSGYVGQYDRYFTKFLKENKEEKELIDYLKEKNLKEVDVKIEEYNFENQDYKNNYDNTPMVCKLKIKIQEPITENAGNLLLVNIGKVIGKQNNLYQESERNSDVDLKYNKYYKHKIIFNIPAEYEIESFNDLLIDRKMNIDNDKNCWFKSTARKEGNQLIVEVEEKYQSLTYAKENYSEYRNVINAAADFNKASVVLKIKK